MSAERKKMKNKNIVARSLDILLLLAAFLLSNIAAYSFTQRFPNLTITNLINWIIVDLCFFIFLVIALRLGSLKRSYTEAWNKQIPLIIFIIFCFSSLLWSVYPVASIYELATMLLISLIGIYISVRYSPQKIFDIVRYFGIFCIFTSYFLILFYPSVGKMTNIEQIGAWQGIFWHRNYLGSLMAFFSMVFVLKMLMCYKNKIQLILNLGFFILSSLLIYESHSATGILIFIMLISLTIISALWLKFRKDLTIKHYLFGLLAVVLIAVLILSNLDLLFGLLGRNTSLTGRVPLWSDLVSKIWSKKPVLGYGFGALWNQEEFRVYMQKMQGWSHPILFSDNGFLDIFLNLGVIGLFLFLVFFVITGYRSGKAFIQNADLISLFPILTFIYILVGNIPFSLFFEMEDFIWVLLVTISALSVSLLKKRSEC